MKQRANKKEFRRHLEQSVETRMQAIQVRISMASTFYTTVVIEARFGDRSRAKDLLEKLRSAVEDLTAHVNNPAHVPGKRLQEGFRKQLAQLRERLFILNAQLPSGERSSDGKSGR